MCLLLCAPLDWQYAELPSSASDAVFSNAVFSFVRCGTSKTNRKEKKQEKKSKEVLGTSIYKLKGKLMLIDLIQQEL